MANMEEAVSGGREKEVKGGGEDITMWDLGVLICGGSTWNAPVSVFSAA